MGEIKSVSDFLKAASAALKDEEADDTIDLYNWESSAVGVGEKNLLRDFEIADKFRKPGMDREFEICALVEQKENRFGEGGLSAQKSYTESFLSKGNVFFDASPLDVCCSDKPGIQITTDNDTLDQSLYTTFSSVSVRNMTGMTMSYIGERVLMGHDMRHLFLKGYLLLMGYNLAVTSDVMEYKTVDWSPKVRTGVTADTKMSLLMNHRVVVDVERLTSEQQWLLAELALPSPTRQYGEKNIYNSICLGEDDVVFVTEKDSFSFVPNPEFESPEIMWAYMIRIARKFNALPDLLEVVRDFRGVPLLLKSLLEFSEQEVFPLAYPKSYSIHLAVGAEHIRLPFVIKHGGYFATSKNLVADLLLGEMCCMSAFNILEEIGAFGMIACPTNNSKTDSFLSSLLKGLGLRSDDESTNLLLLEWRGVRGCKMPLAFSGRLRAYVQNMCTLLRTGDISILRPQLLHALPFSNCRNTTWATIRSWSFPEFEFIDSADIRTMKNKAYTWVMGVSKELPKVGRNVVGASYIEGLSVEEIRFIQLAAGKYEIGLVRHFIAGVLELRVYEYELGSLAFYYTGFPGVRCGVHCRVRCTVVFDDSGEAKMVMDVKG